MKPKRLVALFAVGFLLAGIAVVASRAGVLSEVMANPLVQQIEAEQREFVADATADRNKMAAILDDFTGGGPVEVRSVEKDGAIVANDRGETMFARPDGVALAVGEQHWLVLGEDEIMVGGPVE